MALTPLASTAMSALPAGDEVGRAQLPRSLHEKISDSGLPSIERRSHVVPRGHSNVMWSDRSEPPIALWIRWTIVPVLLQGDVKRRQACAQDRGDRLVTAGLEIHAPRSIAQRLEQGRMDSSTY